GPRAAPDARRVAVGSQLRDDRRDMTRRQGFQLFGQSWMQPLGKRGRSAEQQHEREEHECEATRCRDTSRANLVDFPSWPLRHRPPRYNQQTLREGGLRKSDASFHSRQNFLLAFTASGTIEV